MPSIVVSYTRLPQSGRPGAKFHARIAPVPVPVIGSELAIVFPSGVPWVAKVLNVRVRYDGEGAYVSTYVDVGTGHMDPPMPPFKEVP